MTRGEDVTEKRKYRHGHCSVMSNVAWCDLNRTGDQLNLHDRCPNNNCSCRKKITFTPREFHTEGTGFISKLRNIFKGN